VIDYEIRHTDQENTPTVAANLRQSRSKIAKQLQQKCGKDAANSQ
jgi:hypothetical protein